MHVRGNDYNKWYENTHAQTHTYTRTNTDFVDPTARPPRRTLADELVESVDALGLAPARPMHVVLGKIALVLLCDTRMKTQGGGQLKAAVHTYISSPGI